MSIRKLPRMAFNLQLSRGRRGRKELTRRIAQHLVKRFGRVRAFQPLLWPISTIYLSLSDVGFAVAIVRKRKVAGNNEWKIYINPLVSSHRKLSNEELKNYLSDLMLISNEVHASLTGIPEITRLRCFFDGWDPKIPAVRSPAELPWHADMPDKVG